MFLTGPAAGPYPKHHAGMDFLVPLVPVGASEGGLCPGCWGCLEAGTASQKAARVLGLFLPAGVLQEKEEGEITGTAEKRRWTRAGSLPCLGFPRPVSMCPGWHRAHQGLWGEGWQWQGCGVCT